MWNKIRDAVIVAFAMLIAYILYKLVAGDTKSGNRGNAILKRKYDQYKKKEKENKRKTKELKKKESLFIKTLKDGAKKWGRPLVFVVLFMPELCFGFYTNMNFSEGTNWQWRDKDAYIEYTQWYVFTQSLLVENLKDQRAVLTNRLNDKDTLIVEQQYRIDELEQGDPWYERALDFIYKFSIGFATGYVAGR
jgi:hypothetical protein